MTTQEMRAKLLTELKTEGYEPFVELFNKGLALRHPYEPTMMLWEDGLFFHSISQAHEHMEKERRFKAMKAFIEKIATYDVQNNFNGRMSDAEAIADAHMRNLEELVEEAKKFIKG